jgi:peptidoglycan/LPS O-acetylase OafA/YrhL
MSRKTSAVANASPSDERARLPLVDALRALAATIITWHHFALYWPLSPSTEAVLGEPFEWLRDYARATQIFFVISGYAMARSMSRRTWSERNVALFLVRRYCRIGVPYLCAIAFAIAACAFGRGWLPESVVGSPPTWKQLLAHVFFLQYILGYESLSAGLWFVCINFQLGMIYVALLYLRDRWSRRRRRAGDETQGLAPIILGWPLAAAALFYFNLEQHQSQWDMWAVYFFGHFFLGIIVHESLAQPRLRLMFWLYVAMVGIALIYDWRWRWVVTLASGFILYFGGKSGLISRWPKSRIIAYLGRTSYSFFLIHFPVMVAVAAVWTRMDWATPLAVVTGIVAAYVLSLLASFALYHYVESPAAKLSRHFA